MSEVVPEGWEDTDIGQVVSEIADGGTPATSNPEYFGGRIPWVVIDDIQPRIQTTRTSITDLGLSKSSAKLWKKGTIILSTGATIGRVGIAMNAMATKQGICGVVPNNDVDTDYFYHLLVSKERQLNILSQGSTIKETRPPTIKQIRISLPPLPEQKKIASILTSVDEVIEKTQSQIDKLQDLKKGTMNELLTKGIGHTEFKDSELGRIPKSWEVLPLEEYVSVGRGYAFKSSDFKTEGHPIIRVTNISQQNELDISSDLFCLAPEREMEFANFLLKDNDFLLVMVGATVGKYAKVETKGAKLFLNQNMWRLRTKVTSRHSQSFAIYALQLVVMRFLNTMQGSARDFLTQKEFGKAMVAIPSIAEQEKIQKMLSSIDENLAKRLTKLHQTQSLKKSLMQDLLTGKVRVSVN